MSLVQGHCVLEMPSGTGKTVSLLSLIVSYQQVSACSADATVPCELTYRQPVPRRKAEAHLLLANSAGD